MNLTLTSYIHWIENWTLDAQEVISYYMQKATADKSLNAFIRMHSDYVGEKRELFSSRPLAWAPIAIKDIILTKWYLTSCGSKMLENYVSPYSATCFLRLEQHGGLMIGKANMDEFAMWGSNENSAYGKAFNPHGTGRTPGGSSWWSAAAVAADLCIAALWTDTGWSIRQPAAFCGIVGIKPTYGRVSRYWVSSMASSLDQVWVLTKTVQDAQILLQAISWYDDHDAQSQQRDQDMLTRSTALNQQDLSWIKIWVPKEFFGEWLDPKIKVKIDETIAHLASKWAIIKEISLPMLPHALEVYYTIVFAETSTNQSRFDWLRYWLQDDTHQFADIKDYYKAIRSKWFGKEVKRRILLWTYVLSAANYEWLYLKATKVRKKIIADFDQAFTEVDVIVWPTTPTVAWKMDKEQDPLSLYLADIYTVPANLAGLPAMSVPVWTIEDQWEQMPVWFQILAPQRHEDRLFHIGSIIEWMTL